MKDGVIERFLRVCVYSTLLLLDRHVIVNGRNAILRFDCRAKSLSGRLIPGKEADRPVRACQLRLRVHDNDTTRHMACALGRQNTASTVQHQTRSHSPLDSTPRLLACRKTCRRARADTAWPSEGSCAEGVGGGGGVARWTRTERRSRAVGKNTSGVRIGPAGSGRRAGSTGSGNAPGGRSGTTTRWRRMAKSMGPATAVSEGADDEAGNAKRAPTT